MSPSGCKLHLLPKGVPKGGDGGVEFLEVLEVDGSLQELIGFGDESGTVRGIADLEW